MRATYTINLAQLSNMLLTALVVPLLIGAEHYGKYAAIFAVPAFLQSTIETFAVLGLHSRPPDLRFWRLYFGLVSGALIVSAGVYSVSFSLIAAIWATALGGALLFRSACSALVYTDERVRYVKISVLAEGVTFLCYVGVLTWVYLIDSLNYTAPLLMIIASSVGSGAFILWWYLIETQHGPDRVFDDALASRPFSWKMLFARSYEDFSLTLMPLFLAKSFGLPVAGEFRVIVSCMKVVSKLFPFRYETILRAVRTKEFDPSFFTKISLAFIFFGVLIALLLYFVRGRLFLSIDTPFWIIGFATGFLVTGLAAFPAVALYSRVAIFVAASTALLTCIAIAVGNLYWFLGMFIAMNVAIYLATIRTLCRFGSL